MIFAAARWTEHSSSTALEKNDVDMMIDDYTDEMSVVCCTISSNIVMCRSIDESIKKGIRK